MDMDTKVIDQFSITNQFWKAVAFILNIHESEINQGQGGGQKTPTCKGLKMVRKLDEWKTSHYIFVTATHNFGPIGPKISGSVQNTIMNEIYFVVGDDF